MRARSETRWAVGTPSTTDHTQQIGRILRCDPAPEMTMIDLIDQTLPVLEVSDPPRDEHL